VVSTTKRQESTPIIGPFLPEKNMIFHKEFNAGGSNFAANAGWICCWKNCTEFRSPTSVSSNYWEAKNHF
jgi:hypothetical protein